ncbi:hypothetical protein M378DRAFT_184906 [Amanita muscaria Koide BX008]|uniref:Uncharacterized protein n=1 Tax=Amanita muscaria (strain Koide BX008) TaxID=946122 RepID=A0A0C2XHN5_AMAMK|nr:hypothetical protein M378DRAFT_184906 [Amanita muscaria Koide BX008]
MRLAVFLLGLSPLVTMVRGHLAAWHKGMYCLNGTVPGIPDLNTAGPVAPLYQLSQKDWWFHHINGCDNFPPADGDFLELPAGEQFTVEIAANRGQTTLSFDGRYTSPWPNGQNYPDDYNVPTCITTPNMHTQNQSMAAGTAFAISYQSDIAQVTPENLVVFSVRYHTPWKRVTTYDVPAALPACPPDGCICGIPNGCGQPNMYHHAFKCKVLNAKSTTPVASPKPPVWCEDDPSKCVKGAKQMLYWHQLDGNNIEVDGYDLSNSRKSPAYNEKCGFADGKYITVIIYP